MNVRGRPRVAPHVLITGTSGAIGGAIAREVRRRSASARLSFVDVEGTASEALAAELGGEVSCHARDLSDVDSLPSLVEEVSRRHGPVDGLVNCAGFMQVRRLERIPWEQAELLLRVDLLAPLRLMHAISAEMVERRSGFVVNVASMAGRVPIKGCAYYGAAKAGLAMASEIAHGELARRGIHVVTVYPGPVSSRLEQAARAQFGAGAVARVIPTGAPDALARRILDAVERGEPRVVYPSLYGIGFRFAGFASRVAMALGPEPSA